jgi:hypothetical protein
MTTSETLGSTAPATSAPGPGAHAADEFTFTPSPNPCSAQERAAILADPGFGRYSPTTW